MGRSLYIIESLLSIKMPITSITDYLLTGRSIDHTVNFSRQSEILLERETGLALEALFLKAIKAGFQLKVVSGFRSFERQCSIWNRKFQGFLPLYDRLGELVDRPLSDIERVWTILNWSAIPGGSRHHWGTDVDLIDISRLPLGQKYQLLPAEFEVGGPFFEFYEWMKVYAKDFGFFYPYHTDLGGVMPEPWHITYEPKAIDFEKLLSIGVLKNCLLEEGLGIEGIQILLENLESIYSKTIQQHFIG